MLFLIILLVRELEGLLLGTNFKATTPKEQNKQNKNPLKDLRQAVKKMAWKERKANQH